MAQLSSVISSILRDYVTAQHEANCYIQALSHEYGKEGKLKNFRLPQAVIDDLELDLKYAVQNTGATKENLVIDYKELYLFLEETLTPQIAKVAITAVVHAVSNTDSEEMEEFQNILDKGEKLRTELGAFLGRKITEELKLDSKGILTEEGRVMSDKVIETAIKVVFRELLHHPDLGEVMEGEKGDALKAKIQQDLQNRLTMLIARLTRNFSALRKEMLTTVEITMIADELKEIPPEMIQSLHFKIGNNGMDVQDVNEMSEH